MTFELFYSKHRSMWGVRCVEPDGDCKTIIFHRDICALLDAFDRRIASNVNLRVIQPNECMIPRCKQCSARKD